MPAVTSYEREGTIYKFSPLPANRTTAKLYLALSKVAKDPVQFAEIVGVLPDCIERSMRDHHTEDEMNAFIDTIVLDFGNIESLHVLRDLNMLFMGRDPKAVPADAAPAS